jgi:hypothetical protein
MPERRHCRVAPACSADGLKLLRAPPAGQPRQQAEVGLLRGGCLRRYAPGTGRPAGLPAGQAWPRCRPGAPAASRDAAQQARQAPRRAARLPAGQVDLVAAQVHVCVRECARRLAQQAPERGVCGVARGVQRAGADARAGRIVAARQQLWVPAAPGRRVPWRRREAAQAGLIQSHARKRAPQASSSRACTRHAAPACAQRAALRPAASQQERS